MADRRVLRSRWVFRAACLALVVGGCGDSGGGTTTSTTALEPVAPWPTDGWLVAAPEDVGMDSGVLADLVEQAAAQDGIDSVTVVRNGYVVLDTVIYPFPEETPHDIYSCTKSVTGTLIGIAVDQGLLASVDVPVLELLAGAAPDEVDELKTAMTVEDLLTMSTGLECRDSYLYQWRGLVEMHQSDDWAAHVLALPMSEEPGTRFEYCNGASFLLSAILSEVTGKPAAEYADEVLFQPLGITESSWPANPAGITSGAGGLMLRPLDVAKIGYLYLRGGEWDGIQLVPASWIEAATSAQITAGTASDGYGYQWWVDDAGYAMAIGSGGQYVVVAPDHDLVVVFTSGLPPGKDQSPEELTTEYVFKAVVSDDPLPPNPGGQARLAAAVAAAGSGPEPAAAEMPKLAASVDGVRFEFRPNAFGNTWFTLSFDETTARFQLQDVDGPIGLAKAVVDPDDLEITGLQNIGRPIDVVVGLDGRFATDEFWGLPTALRGAWATGDTFVIEYQLIGLEARGAILLRFGADIARMTFLETITRVNQMSTADRVG